jgi:hypothetical protein
LVTQSVDSGTLVRIQFDSGSAVRGRLMGALQPGAQWLQLCLYPGRQCSGATDARVRTLDASAIRRLEVSAGGRSGTGALIGGVLGFLAGALAHGFASDTDSGGHPQSVMPFLVRGVLGGALWGVIVGGSLDSWRRAP